MSEGGGWLAAGTALLVVGVIAVVVIFGFLFSFHGVDSGSIAFVREGGPFDGRNVTEVRQPGSGPKSIGIWNHQDELPITERDLTDEVDNITVPSKDGVDMVVNGQALFKLTTDPAKAKEFYLKYGRRTWDGHNLTEDEGWSAFLRLRLIPVLQDTLRQTVGKFDCVQLKNTCVYVLDAEQLADADGASKAQQKARQVNNTQVIQQAQNDITSLLTQKMRSGLGGDYFEGVRFQNLKPDFTNQIAERVRAAQGKRAEVAEARLEAQRVKEAAKGQANRAIEEARGERDSNLAKASGIRAVGRAYRSSPQVAKIDQTKAFCGPDGCDPQVIGGNVFQQLAGR